jgi:hypothetical protein
MFHECMNEWIDINIAITCQLDINSYDHIINSCPNLLWLSFLSTISCTFYFFFFYYNLSFPNSMNYLCCAIDRSIYSQLLCWQTHNQADFTLHFLSNPIPSSSDEPKPKVALVKIETSRQSKMENKNTSNTKKIFYSLLLSPRL